MKDERTYVKRAAQIVSIVGHPFVLIPLTILLAVFRKFSPAQAFKIELVTVSLTIAPLFFIIRRQVAAGNWADHDVSVARERVRFYPIAIGVAMISGLIFWLLDFPRPLLIGIFISVLLLFLSMLINQWSKISLHLIFAMYCALSLFAVNYRIGAGFIALAVAVGWSRIILERHTLAQVLSGMALGALGGICLLKAVGYF